ncbi:MAG: SBBP repeat-containing protein, partial [candidate division WOR-3 bacterium]
MFKKISYYHVFLVALVIFEKTYPQPVWINRYNEVISGRDGIKAIAADSLGNIYLAGWTGTINCADYLVIKLNSLGETLWTRTYNGPGNGHDCANAIAIDNLGNVYVTGESYGNDNNYDYATVKFDVNGNQQWLARYNGPGNGNDYAYAIAVDHFGNIYVTGESDGISSFSDFATIKYSPDGIELWVQRYNGADNDVDWASGLWIDNAGNVYVVGTSYHNITDNDYTTIKYDANGTCEWIRFYDGPASYDD